MNSGSSSHSEQFWCKNHQNRTIRSKVIALTIFALEKFLNPNFFCFKWIQIDFECTSINTFQLMHYKMYKLKQYCPTLFTLVFLLFVIIYDVWMTCAGKIKKCSQSICKAMGQTNHCHLIVEILLRNIHKWMISHCCAIAKRDF